MKLRKIVTAAALAVVSTLGLTVPLATPAAAATCDTASSVYGASDTRFVYRGGAYDMSWTTTARAAGSCSGAYKYEQFVFDGSTLYARNAVNGTDSAGNAAFPLVVTKAVPSGTTQLTLGIRVSKYNFYYNRYDEVSERAWVIDVPDHAYDSASGTHAKASCDDIQFRGYGDGCVPPNIPFIS